MKKLALHWQILIGMSLGVIVGLALSASGMIEFSKNYIAPFGTIFINLLKLIAVPLVLVSLISGVASLKDIAKLSRLGGKTVGIYLLTTVLAVSLGLVIVNVIQPGKSFSKEKQEEFRQKFAAKAAEKQQDASSVKQQSTLQPIVDMFPENIIEAMKDNRNMLQVIVFAILFGTAMVMVSEEITKPVKDFFTGLNDIIIKMVEIIMMFAPFGVFALISSLIVEFAGDNPANAFELFKALGLYSFSVVIGLILMMSVVYAGMLRLFVGYSPVKFFKGIAPAQLLAFSTSSSAATLPVTMECVEKNLKVPEEISSFVLPVGATVNMDGTSLYQAVAAVFIAQAFGMELGLEAQLGIIVTATLASIGSAAVPGAGLVMLIIVLEQANIPVEGLSLIFAVDRILDMCRTVVNITGDACVATFISASEGELAKD